MKPRDPFDDIELELELAETEPPPEPDEIPPARLIEDREHADRDIARWLAGEDAFTSWGPTCRP
ncbi:MAG: hypothetical protein QOG85_840 [Gaiellaceae bacterium]|jgi:hypothetical protein|nr:hypothetical protein [Gaiellaceae bacterium]